MNQGQQTYQCPGDRYAIDRATHLGRLATFYPACRQCAHRDDTGTLSSVQVSQLIETRRRAERPSMFVDEGIAGACVNEINSIVARQFAEAFGVHLQRSAPANVAAPAVALGSDDRSLTAELVAAASEGLRRAGCALIEVGGVTAACLIRAALELDADGALLVGNATGQRHIASLKVWGKRARPWSAGGTLDAVRQTVEAGVDRPCRNYGPLRRVRATDRYLPALEHYFHGLRPLRFVLDTASIPLAHAVRQLIGNSACQVYSPRDASIAPHAAAQLASDGNDTAAQSFLARRLTIVASEVRTQSADFGLWIDGDGEVCHVLDEQGRRVAGDRLLVALSEYLFGQRPLAAVAVERSASAQAARAIAALGGTVVPSNDTREAMYESLTQSQAPLGGGPSGRFWFQGETPVADALLTASLLLTILSQTDRPLSMVLDAACVGS